MRSMRVNRARRSGLALVTGCLWLASGCGSSQPETGKTVYYSAEELQTKEQGVKDAMKGGAYGAAGRKAAAQFGSSSK